MAMGRRSGIHDTSAMLPKGLFPPAMNAAQSSFSNGDIITACADVK